MSSTRKILTDHTSERIIVRFTHKETGAVVYPGRVNTGHQNEWYWTGNEKEAHEFKNASTARALCKVTHLVRERWDDPEWDHEVVKITKRTVRTKDTEVLWPKHPLETLARA